MAGTMRTKVVSAGVLLAVFVAGALVGAAFDRTLGAAPAETGERIPPVADARSDEDGERRERRRGMWERVDPTEDQRVVIDSILRHHRARMGELRDDFESRYNPRYWAIVDSTRNGIRAVFNEDQRIRYDSMTAAFDERRMDESGDRRSDWDRDRDDDRDRNEDTEGRDQDQDRDGGRG